MQLLESRIKNEIIEKRQLVRALSSSEDNKPSSSEPLPSMSVACGASTFEVWITMPKWAAQVFFFFKVFMKFSVFTSAIIYCIPLYLIFFFAFLVIHLTPYVANYVVKASRACTMQDD